jgi:hypothetical protein
MSKTKTLSLLGILLLTIALFAARYMKDIARVQGVEAGNTPLQLGTIQKLVFTNNQPKSGIYPVAGNASGGLKVPSVGAILSLT